MEGRLERAEAALQAFKAKEKEWQRAWDCINGSNVCVVPPDTAPLTIDQAVEKLRAERDALWAEYRDIVMGVRR